MVTHSGFSCSCCSAQQLVFSAAAHPALQCSHQRALLIRALSSSSAGSSSSFSKTHNQTRRQSSPSHHRYLAETYLTEKSESAERSYRDLLKWRAAAEPKRKTKEEKFELPDFFEIDRDTTAAFNLLFETDQILQTARHYEVVFLVHETHVDQLPEVIQKVKDFIEERKGKIHRFNDWGLRKLAYKIKKARCANYILMNIQIDAKEIEEFKFLLDKDERVIRHLVITMKEAETAETVPPPEYTSIRDEENLDEDELDGSEFEDDEEEDGEDEEVEEEDHDGKGQEAERAKEGELTQV
ncbi:hypothetical protein GOP47_0001559 [Adiantum capillus-veneris]|uniref:30S ribosomal protein S6 n=1 Tax=Adiantum capillus-veneris TaxID=13818 RepID=A0A9D4V9R9_ADICA|nr:hypothetical protein GOP47_0001559 [Adiantum capillus-veneris]